MVPLRLPPRPAVSPVQVGRARSATVHEGLERPAALPARMEKTKDNITLRDILKHTILTNTENKNNIEILEEKILTQDEKDLELLQK